jgi:hypothetical protein
LSNAAVPALRTRSFTFSYQATVRDIPAGTKHADLWLPVPHDDPHRQFTNLKSDSHYAHKVETGTEGNTMLHGGVDIPKDTSTVSIQFNAMREEHRHSSLYSGPKLARDEDPNWRSG